ncbi:MAG: cytochrome c, partial [Planctomycetes bacterium]|nr:cytochrome c [Planctomycetota bacterium]
VEAIVACSHVGTVAAAVVAVQALAAPRDRFIDYALAQTLRALQPQWAPALADGSLAVHDPDQLALLRRSLGTVAEAPHPGRLVYESLCLNCHQADGRGLAGIYPPLAASEWVTGPTRPLARILLHGLGGRITVAGGTYGVQVPLPMPPMGLNDRQMADVLTYVRSAFGNQAGAVTADEVATERAASAAHVGAWTAEDLVK